MNQEKKNNLQNQPKSNNEIESLKKALAEKDKELAENKNLLEKKELEKAEIRQVLKDEEEKSLLKKYGFASEELENIRLLSQGEITENKLKELKIKSQQKRTNAFLSLLQDDNIYQKEQSEPWEKQIKYMETHPKGKIR